MDLNPIVTSALSSERLNQVLITNPQSNQSGTSKKNFTSLGIGCSVLSRPKLKVRKPSLPVKNLVEQEITVLSSGIDKDIHRTEKHKKQSPLQVNSFPLSIEGIEPTPLRFGSSVPVLSPPHGPILPSQTFVNLCKNPRQNAAVGLSIISTPAPVQYKEDPMIKRSPVSAGGLELSGAYR